MVEIIHNRYEENQKKQAAKYTGKCSVCKSTLGFTYGELSHRSAFREGSHKFRAGSYKTLPFCPACKAENAVIDGVSPAL